MRHRSPDAARSATPPRGPCPCVATGTEATRWPCVVGIRSEKNGAVDVQLVYFQGCPSWQVARQRLRSALDSTGNDGTPVQLVEVQSASEIAGTCFAGSPTLLIDG